MPDKTETNLACGFAGECKAGVRNKSCAKQAETDGYPKIVRLFRSIGDAESVYAWTCLRVMHAKIGSTEENIETAFQNEIKPKKYPKLIKHGSDEEKKSEDEAPGNCPACGTVKSKFRQVE